MVIFSGIQDLRFCFQKSYLGHKLIGFLVLLFGDMESLFQKAFDVYKIFRKEKSKLFLSILKI